MPTVDLLGYLWLFWPQKTNKGRKTNSVSEGGKWKLLVIFVFNTFESIVNNLVFNNWCK